MSIYKLVKSRVKILEIASRYGLTVKGNKALCPFHKERAPSLSFKEDYFMCFVCGAKGDSITLVTKMFNLTPYEALKKLSSDFCLGLTINKVQTSSLISDYNWESELQTAFIRWCNRAIEVLNSRVKQLKKVINLYEPKTQQEVFHPLFVDALNKIDYYEYLLDELVSGNDLEQVIFYKIKRNEVEKIGRG